MATRRPRKKNGHVPPPDEPRLPVPIPKQLGPGGPDFWARESSLSECHSLSLEARAFLELLAMLNVILLK